MQKTLGKAGFWNGEGRTRITREIPGKIEVSKRGSAKSDARRKTGSARQRTHEPTGHVRHTDFRTTCISCPRTGRKALEYSGHHMKVRSQPDALYFSLYRRHTLAAQRLAEFSYAKVHNVVARSRATY